MVLTNVKRWLCAVLSGDCGLNTTGNSKWEEYFCDLKITDEFESSPIAENYTFLFSF